MNWLVKTSQTSPVVLYHGTLRAHLPHILQSGLKVSEGWGGANSVGVYLSATPSGALFWAKIAFQRSIDQVIEVSRFDRHYGDRATELLVILRVSIPPSHLNLLKADMEQAEDCQFDCDESDWQASLKQIGDVRYDGDIPPQWLQVNE